MQTREERNSFERNIVYILMIAGKDSEIIELIQKETYKPVNHIFMTLYESIINQGKTLGNKEGKREGQKEGFKAGISQAKKEVILAGYQNGLDIKLLANITELDEKDVLKILEDSKKS